MGERKVFENIGFSLEPGQSLAVTGPNGSGKTTLLRIVIGLTPPTKGQVSFLRDGKRIDFNIYRKELSLVAPYISLYGSLTARENLRFLSKVNGNDIDNAAINNVLDQIGLEGRGDDYGSEYS